MQNPNHGHHPDQAMGDHNPLTPLHAPWASFLMKGCGLQRITAEAALEHEWFTEVPLPKAQELMVRFRVLRLKGLRFKV